MNEATKIYLAVCYQYKGRFKWFKPLEMLIRAYRFWKVNKKAAELMTKGYIVFSPISHSRPICYFVTGKDKNGWEFWKEQDYPFVEWADEVHVYMLRGWKDSVGVRDEILYAKSLYKPIIYHKP